MTGLRARRLEKRHGLEPRGRPVPGEPRGGPPVLRGALDAVRAPVGDGARPASGQWPSNLRHPGALDDHPAWEAALREVDEDWNPAWVAKWQRHYAAVREILVEESVLAYVEPGVTVHGMDVGRWLQKQRQHTVWQGLMDGQRELLKQLGRRAAAPGRGSPDEAVQGRSWGVRAGRCGLARYKA